MKPSLVDDNAVYRLFPWGCPLLTHVSKNICSYLSCVSEVPRSSFLFERHLSEMMPPYGFNAPKKVLTHVCRNFLACFCVSEILIHRNRPQKTICHFFCWTSCPLSLTFYFLCLSPSGGCLRRCHVPTHPSHLPPPLMSLPMSFTSTFL